MSESLTHSTVHGLKWSYASTGVTMVLQIGVTALLARLLTPSAFGLVAMANVMLWYGQQFALMGAGEAIIQRSNLGARDIHTAFTSALLMGAAFCALFVVLAPLAGILFPDTPGVVSVTRVMSLSFVIGGLRTTTEGLLRRRFAFRDLALIQIGSYVLGYALVGVTMALLDFGAWSLVVASLCAGALAAAGYTILCRHEVGLSLHWHSFKTIYSFGGRVALIGFGQAVASSLDTFWSGHYLGAAATGLYTRATSLANVPVNALLLSWAGVLMPGFSRLQHDRDRLRSVYIVTITMIAAIGMPLAWGMAGASRQIIITLLGPQWTEAIPVLAVLALAVPFTVLTHIAAIVCEATATLNVKIVIVAGRLAWFVALLSLLTRYGIVGIAAAFALSELTNHVAYLLVMRRMFGLGPADLWSAYSIGCAAGVITGTVLFGINVGLTGMGWPAPIILTVQVAVGALLLLGTITRARRGGLWREVRGRLDEAGYRRENRGMVAWVIRRLDGFSRRESAA